MKLNVEIKIKMDDGTKMTLNSDEARELFHKLQEIYGKEREIVSLPYPVYPRRWDYWPYDWPHIWSSSSDTITMNCSVST